MTDTEGGQLSHRVRRDLARVSQTAGDNDPRRASETGKSRTDVGWMPWRAKTVETIGPSAISVASLRPSIAVKNCVASSNARVPVSMELYQ